MAEPEVEAKAFNRMRPPQHDSHHKHYTHELGKDEYRLAKDFLAYLKRGSASQARIEAMLVQVLSEIAKQALDQAKVDEIFAAVKANNDKLSAAVDENPVPQ